MKDKNSNLVANRLVKAFLKNKIIASNDPKCRLISNWRLPKSKSLIFDTVIKCADELTGVNSEIPWIIAKIRVSIYFEIIKSINS